MGELVLMQKLQSFQTLLRDWLNLTQRKTFVFIEFDEIIETFAKSFENQTHVFSLFASMHEVLFEVHNSKHGTAFVHDVRENIDLNLRTLIVSFHRPDDFDGIILVLDDIETLEGPAKCSISKMCIDLYKKINQKFELTL